ncbi:hypothetical protein HYY75_07690 [bacterium]|nr:hypothetical protein [bacterium]
MKKFCFLCSRGGFLIPMVLGGLLFLWILGGISLFVSRNHMWVQSRWKSRLELGNHAIDASRKMVWRLLQGLNDPRENSHGLFDAVRSKNGPAGWSYKEVIPLEVKGKNNPEVEISIPWATELLVPNGISNGWIGEIQVEVNLPAGLPQGIPRGWRRAFRVIDLEKSFPHGRFGLFIRDAIGEFVSERGGAYHSPLHRLVISWLAPESGGVFLGSGDTSVSTRPFINVGEWGKSFEKPEVQSFFEPGKLLLMLPQYSATAEFLRDRLHSEPGVCKLERKIFPEPESPISIREFYDSFLSNVFGESLPRVSNRLLCWHPMFNPASSVFLWSNQGSRPKWVLGPFLPRVRRIWALERSGNKQVLPFPYSDEQIAPSTMLAPLDPTFGASPLGDLFELLSWKDFGINNTEPTKLLEKSLLDIPFKHGWSYSRHFPSPEKFLEHRLVDHRTGKRVLILDGIDIIESEFELKGPLYYSGVGVLLVRGGIRIFPEIIPLDETRDRLVLWAAKGDISILGNGKITAYLCALSPEFPNSTCDYNGQGCLRYDGNGRIDAIRSFPGNPLNLTGGLVADHLKLTSFAWKPTENKMVFDGRYSGSEFGHRNIWVTVGPQEILLAPHYFLRVTKN